MEGNKKTSGTGKVDIVEGEELARRRRPVWVDVKEKIGEREKVSWW